MLSEISLASFAHVGIPLVKIIHYLPETRIANVLSVRMERVKNQTISERVFCFCPTLVQSFLAKNRLSQLPAKQNNTWYLLENHGLFSLLWQLGSFRITCLTVKRAKIIPCFDPRQRAARWPTPTAGIASQQLVVPLTCFVTGVRCNISVLYTEKSWNFNISHKRS